MLPHKYKFMPWSVYLEDVFSSYKESVVHWFKCRMDRHQVKFGSYGNCIYCHKHIGYGKA